MINSVAILGTILTLGILGCGGNSQKAATSQGEEKGSVQKTVQPETSSSQEGRASAQASQASQVTLKVDGMTCGGCEYGVKNCLVKLDGVKEAR